MTTIIKIFLIEDLYLHCEKNYIPISALYGIKTGTSGHRVYC